MNSDQRAHYEHLILLRSSGELSAAEEAQLATILAEDAELKSFANTLDDLRILTRAPRDFAAEAIAEAMPAAAPRDFAAVAIQHTRQVQQPRRRYYTWVAAAAAAVALMFGINSLQQPSAPQQRVTSVISQQLDSIEQELSATPRPRLRHLRPSI